MAENRVKDFINTVDLVKEQMVQKQEISTIAVAVKLEGLDQVNEELDKMLIKVEKANSLADELASKIKDLCSKTILSDEWRELIVEDAKTKEKLVIINSDGVEITSSDLNVRLVPKVRSNPDELKDLKNKAKELLNTVDSEKEISAIAVAVKLEGLDQVNEELDKMLNKLEKANSLADELASKLKNELDIDCSKVANLVSETIRGKASIAR
jgi:hypothetical protein